MPVSLVKYIDFLVNEGATIALVIDTSAIVVADWPIMKCRYGCPNYGKNRACPPFAPAAEETRCILAGYSRAILFCTEKMDAGTPLALSCLSKLNADGFYRSIGFGTGPCTLCSECKLHDCPMPYKVLPSPEACGVDVVATVRRAGLSIDMPPKPGAPLKCYGFILVD